MPFQVDSLSTMVEVVARQRLDGVAYERWPTMSRPGAVQIASITEPAPVAGFCVTWPRRPAGKGEAPTVATPKAIAALDVIAAGQAMDRRRAVEGPVAMIDDNVAAPGAVVATPLHVRGGAMAKSQRHTGIADLHN